MDNFPTKLELKEKLPWYIDDVLDDQAIAEELLTDPGDVEEGLNILPLTREPFIKEDTGRVNGPSSPDEESREGPSSHEQFDELLDLLTRLTLCCETFMQQHSSPS